VFSSGFKQDLTMNLPQNTKSNTNYSWCFGVSYIAAGSRIVLGSIVWKVGKKGGGRWEIVLERGTD
jgi:hypothetical protein